MISGYLSFGLTTFNGILLKKSKNKSNLDKIVLLATAAVCIDAMIAPKFTGGRPIHEILGLNEMLGYMYNDESRLSTIIAESASVYIGNAYLILKNAYCEWRNIGKEKQQAIKPEAVE